MEKSYRIGEHKFAHVYGEEKNNSIVMSIVRFFLHIYTVVRAIAQHAPVDLFKNELRVLLIEPRVN